jgi:hypothetical protein
MTGTNEYNIDQDINFLTEKYALIKPFILKSYSIYFIERIYPSILNKARQFKIFLHVSYLLH